MRPKKFCNPWQMMIKYSAKASQDGVPYTFTWTEHTHTCLLSSRQGIGCSIQLKKKNKKSIQVCEHFSNLAREEGQNRKEFKLRGRPAGESSKSLIEHIDSTAPASFTSTDVEQLQYPTTPLTEQLSCPICPLFFSNWLSCLVEWSSAQPAAQSGWFTVWLNVLTSPGPAVTVIRQIDSPSVHHHHLSCRCLLEFQFTVGKGVVNQ